MATIREYSRQFGAQAGDFSGRRATPEDMGVAGGIADLAQGIGQASAIMKQHEENAELAYAQVQVAEAENVLDEKVREIQAKATPGVSTTDEIKSMTSDYYAKMGGQYKTQKAQQYIKMHGINQTGNRVKSSVSFDADLFVRDQSAKRDSLFDGASDKAYANPDGAMSDISRLQFDSQNKLGVFSTSGDPRVDIAMGEVVKKGINKIAWSAMIGSLDRNPAVRGSLAGVHQTGFNNLVSSVISREGGFVANDNKQGPTNFGINGKANGMSEQEVKSLTKEDAAAIYKKNYWDKYGVGDLPANVQAIVFDGVVNHRSEFASQLVSAASSGASPQDLASMRKAEYQRLANVDPDNVKYLKSWTQRVDETVGKVVETSAEHKMPNSIEGLPYWDLLTTDQKHRAVSMADQKNRKEQAVADASLKKTMADQEAQFITQGRMTSQPIPASSFTDPVQYKDYQNFYETAKLVETMIDINPAAQAAYMKMLEPKEGQEPGLYASQAKRYETAQRLVADANKERNKDPVLAARSRGFSTENPIVTIEDYSAEKIGEQLAIRLPQAEAIREQYGQPSVKPLMEYEAKNMRQHFNQLPSDKKAEYIDSIASSVSKEQFQHIANQVWKDDHAIRAAGLLAVKSSGMVQNGESADRASQLIMAGHEVISLTMKGIGGETKSGTKSILPSTEDVREVVGEHLKGQKITEEAIQSITAAVRAHYIGFMTSDGAKKTYEVSGTDTTSTNNMKSLVKSAQTIIGTPSKIGPSIVSRPWGVTDSQFNEKVKEQASEMGYGGQYYGLQPIGNGKYAIMIDGMAIDDVIDMNKPSSGYRNEGFGTRKSQAQYPGLASKDVPSVMDQIRGELPDIRVPSFGGTSVSYKDLNK